MSNPFGVSDRRIDLKCLLPKIRYKQELLNQTPEWKKSTVLLPGAGTSILIEELLSNGVKLILNDISNEALNRVKERLKNKSGKVEWLCQDIAQPIQSTLPKVDIWIDRAVLHFLTQYH